MGSKALVRDANERDYEERGVGGALLSGGDESLERRGLDSEKVNFCATKLSGILTLGTGAKEAAMTIHQAC